MTIIYKKYSQIILYGKIIYNSKKLGNLEKKLKLLKTNGCISPECHERERESLTRVMNGSH